MTRDQFIELLNVQTSRERSKVDCVSNAQDKRVVQSGIAFNLGNSKPLDFQLITGSLQIDRFAKRSFFKHGAEFRALAGQDGRCDRC